MGQHKKEKIPGKIFSRHMIYKMKELMRLRDYVKTLSKILVSNTDVNNNKNAEDKIDSSGDHPSPSISLGPSRMVIFHAGCGKKQVSSARIHQQSSSGNGR